jgi:UDP-2-acetamido-3-amino-2,3-dideoxy-glucuronate N-acetyltransferase
MVSIAVVGIGNWGKNLVRNLVETGDVVSCCHDGATDNEEWLRTNYPGIDVTTEYASILEDPSIDAVVIATPIDTHYELARAALEAGKHVFVEKPLASTVERAASLRDLALESGLVLFVGYVFLHHPLVRPILSRAQERPVRSVAFAWEKLGAFDEDILLDLVCHPVSIACGLFGGRPERVSVHGELALTGCTDLISVALEFVGGARFDVRVNRVSPNESRSMLVAFEDETFCWTDRELYRFDGGERRFELIRTREREPLRLECEAFVAAIEEGADPVTDGEFGYLVNEVLGSLRARTAAEREP